MCKFVVTSRELRDEHLAIPCQTRSAAQDITQTLKTTHHSVYSVEVTPVVLFMPSGAKVDAFVPLPTRGTRKAFPGGAH